MAIIPRPYIVNPFGIDGDGDPGLLNTGTGNTGIVNYQYGFTPNYALPNDDPTMLPVPRTDTNQVLCDISYGLQNVQQQGFATWISSSASPNPGPASYGLGVWIFYNNAVWISQTAANTSIPGADANWVQVLNNAQGNAAGEVIDFAGPIPPSGYLLCDGTAYSRTTYATLFAAITQTQTCTTTDTLFTLTVISNAAMYVGMAIEGAGIPVGTTLTVVDYLTPTTVTMSLAATASASVSVRFFSWGNGDGSTTFNVPLLSGRVAMGSGGTAVVGVIGTVTGQVGGESAHVLTVPEIPNHSHPGSSYQVWASNTGGSSPALPVQFLKSSLASQSVSVAPEGGGLGHNNIQPSAIMTKCIKY